jgi:glycosyltransferase involved in cell wall biosynthesis
MPHKQIDVAVEAFTKLGRPLVIVGDGPSARQLRRSAGRTVHFAGRQSDAAVAEILRGARALIVTAVEEFGIAAVESQAAGRPVIARRGGGALETVVEGVTGTFFAGGPDQLAEAVRGFDDAAIDPAACRRNAELFDAVNFRWGIRAEVDLAYAGARPQVRERQPLASTRLVKRAVRDPLR